MSDAVEVAYNMYLEAVRNLDFGAVVLVEAKHITRQVLSSVKLKNARLLYERYSNLKKNLKR